MRRASLLLLVALAGPAAAAPSPSPIAAVPVSTRTLALPDLVAQVQRDGETAVLTNPLAAQIGVDDPTTAKVLHYPEGADTLTRSVYVSQQQAPFKTGEPPRPQLVIFLTEKTTPRVIERAYLRLGLDGQLEQATLVRDKLDADGAVVPGGRTVESVPLKRAQKWLDHENDFYFHGLYRKTQETP